MSSPQIHYGAAFESMCFTVKIAVKALERDDVVYALDELRGAQERAERLGREFYAHSQELTAKARKAAGLDAAE